MKKNNFRNREGVVFSTNSDFKYSDNTEEEREDLPNKAQKLRVFKEVAGRRGKVATVVKGFLGTDESLEGLARYLKTKLGTGGSAKEGEIIIQGEWLERVKTLLRELGYTDTK